MDRIWTFKTKTLEVFCEWEEETDEDLSWADEETLHKLDMGEYVNVCWHVGVLVNGTLYAEEYLGNSVYENPPDSFRREHLGVAPKERAGGFTYATNFRSMLGVCLAKTRKMLRHQEEQRDRARRYIADFYAAFEHHECRYGHQQCAIIPGGRCFDETLCNYPELQDEEG